VAAVYTPDMTESMRKDLEDLDVLALGDSTFWGDEYAWEYQWINWLARECGWALSNISAGGESISHRETQNQSACVDRLFNEPEYKFGGANSSSAPYRYTNEEALGKSKEDVDLILISYGHNDFGGASIIAPRGEMSLENRDTTTYVGAWNVVLEELLRQYPNAKIVIVNQWHLRTGSSANEGLTREEYYHSVVEMYYEYYHEMDRIYLLDAGDTRISGVDMNNADFRAQYSRNPNDVFHLNRDGMAIMKDAMLPYLWNLAVRELEDK
jgi:lysophospholipase L1-like esterase